MEPITNKKYTCDSRESDSYCSVIGFDETNHCECFCSEITSVCEESQMCVSHCTLENHSHCIVQECFEINTIKNTYVCDSTSECHGHCTTPNHGHCIDDYCYETKNVSKVNSFCENYCELKNIEHFHKRTSVCGTLSCYYSDFSELTKNIEKN